MEGAMVVFQQLAVQGSLPGVRAGHAAVTIGTKASNVSNACTQIK